MITIKNARTLGGQVEDWNIESATEEVIDAKGKLTVLPGLIDAHVHFRTPGHEYKEDWTTGAQAAIAGGVTTVCDMPNNSPPCVDLPSCQAKKRTIDDQLSRAKIPLRYHLYIGADKDHLEQIGRVKREVTGIKIYMGSTTGGLIMDNHQFLDRVFQIAAQENMMVSVHAEDEKILKENKALYATQTDPAVHSKIRDRSAAIKATEQAISLAEKYSTQLLIHHVSTKEELELIRQAKRNNILVYGETTPHHLFLSEEDYTKWGAKVQVNPPVRTKNDQEALWEAIHDNTIDTIGSDHAPHTLEEKKQPYGKSPSGIPGIETMLPLLLNAYHEKRLSLENIVYLTRINPENIFHLPHNSDLVLVDLEMEKEVCDANLKTKCGWSPFSGRTLKGWPVYTIVSGQIFKIG
ncbi:MAG: Dihydroorotase [Chlamydiae bacterium]|nr:Dihydroorotase [Chlamydiota bacterium]